MKKNTKVRRLEHWQKIALMLMIYDIIVVNISYLAALWFRFDCRYSAIPMEYMTTVLYFAPIYTVACLLVFWRMRLYNSIWRFASINEVMRVGVSTVITVAAYVICTKVFLVRLPISCYIIGAGFQFVLMVCVRFSYRVLLMFYNRNASDAAKGRTQRIMVIGAGNAGQAIIHDARRLKEEFLKICCIIDDCPNKWGRDIDGIPVVGGRDDIMLNVEKYNINKILVAINRISPEEKRDILNICKETGCEIKNLPSVPDMVSGKLSIGDMKDVAVEDLLGRDPITVNMDDIYNQITGKTILVTGGGGSIGSELCRQVAPHNPKELIIFDVYENNAYDIQQELKERYPQLKLTVLIGSVRDSRRIESVFAEHHPDIVYHAAAHKHVPLMEDSPCEAIKNNVIGTYKTAYAALLYGCKRFVLISTDKAVNPTNVMGASKRLCEMVIQSFDRAVKEGTADRLPVLFTHEPQQEAGEMKAQKGHKYITEFVAVRFGNVLGSNGSVIPLFKKQIAKGGPITVTHPDIIRYFMTIPEAVSLVMQAGTYAKGGEIFVLDMGAPVKIDDLARNLIKLSGYRPDIDIPVLYSGLRPGEKLYEEKLMAEEGMQKTDNDLIHIGNPIAFDMDRFMEDLQMLMAAAYANVPNMQSLIQQVVPTYHRENCGEKDETYEMLHKETVGV